MTDLEFQEILQKIVTAYRKENISKHHAKQEIKKLLKLSKRPIVWKERKSNEL